MRKAPKIFNQAGVTMALLAKKVKQLLEAKMMRHYTSIVMDTKVDDAVGIQAKVVEFGLRVHSR